MFGESKNLKDMKQVGGKSDLELSSYGRDVFYKTKGSIMNYTKLNKLITALYIVTDIMDKSEPIRLKLRTLGVEILSDARSSSVSLHTNIESVLSFLNIASTIHLISEMNSNILKKAFLEFGHSIQKTEFIEPNWLEGFLSPEEKEIEEISKSTLSNFYPKLNLNSKGHRIGHVKDENRQNTRLGVQKGGTLMKALSDSSIIMSDRNMLLKEGLDFNLIRQERQNDIVKLIKDNGGKATITDIKTKVHGSLINCGEKTLQRELVYMVKTGILKKTGDKRWSVYWL